MEDVEFIACSYHLPTPVSDLPGESDGPNLVARCTTPEVDWLQSRLFELACLVLGGRGGGAFVLTPVDAASSEASKTTTHEPCYPCLGGSGG